MAEAYRVRLKTGSSYTLPNSLGAITIVAGEKKPVTNPAVIAYLKRDPDRFSLTKYDPEKEKTRKGKRRSDGPALTIAEAKEAKAAKEAAEAEATEAAAKKAAAKAQAKSQTDGAKKPAKDTSAGSTSAETGSAPPPTA